MKRKSLGRPEKSILKKEMIIVKALKLIDQKGVHGFSMRELAKELKVDPMAIYHYVPNKESLLQEVVNLIFDSLDIPIINKNNWKNQIKNLLNNYRSLIKKHPNLVYFILTEPSFGIKSSMEFNEKIFQLVRLSQLPKVKTILLGNLLIDYLHGFALAEGSMSKDIAPMSIEDKYNYPNFNDAFNFNLKKKDSLFDETIDFILTFF